MLEWKINAQQWAKLDYLGGGYVFLTYCNLSRVRHNHTNKKYHSNKTVQLVVNLRFGVENQNKKKL